MSLSSAGSEEGTSTDRRDSERKKSQDEFPSSAQHARLTYGVRGVELAGGPYIEVWYCL